MDIRLYGDIGGYSWWDYDSESYDAPWMVEQLDAVPLNENRVGLYIDSPGGICHDGVNIYNQIRLFANRRRESNPEFVFETIIDGYAYSAAGIIFMAGDKRYMNPGTMFMMHRASTYMYGNAVEYKKEADYLDKVDVEFAQIFTKVMGLKESEVMDLLTAETYMGGNEAVKMKIADAILDPDKKSKSITASKYNELAQLRPGEYHNFAFNRFQKTITARSKRPKVQNKESFVEAPDTSWIESEIRRVKVEQLRFSSV